MDGDIHFPSILDQVSTQARTNGVNELFLTDQGRWLKFGLLAFFEVAIENKWSKW